MSLLAAADLPDAKPLVYSPDLVPPPPALAKDWTDEEERRARTKLDFILLPLLMLGFFSLQLDRGNIGNALTDFFLRDVGITQNQFNAGQQLLSAGIVLLEIPSNMVLYRVGAQRWLSFQVLAFGLVSTFQAFQHGLGAWLSTRLLLGLTEAGYIPGSLYVLSTWYTRRETAKRTVLFFFGSLTAAASTSLIAFGILHMRGVGGKPGWFWLLLLMGLFTIASALLLALFLPDSVDKPTPWLLPRLRYFTARELHILRHRVVLDDPTKGNKKAKITLAELKSALSHWALYPHILITLTSLVAGNAFVSYVPIIISGYGFGRLQSNAFASVGSWICIPVAFCFAYVSDRFNRRGTTVIVGLVLALVFMAMNLGLTVNTSTAGQLKDAKYAGIVMVFAFVFQSHPMNITWLSLHCRSNSERAIWMACIIMCANASGIIGAQIFRSDDLPRYVRGWGTLVGFNSLALLIGIGLALYYRLRRKPETGHALSVSPSSTASIDEKAADALA